MDSNQEQYNFYPFNYDKGRVIRYKNRIVIKIDTGYNMFWNGYVLLKKSDIPKDWWGNYNAPGLSQLNIYGGITYCRQEGVPGQDIYDQKLKQDLEDYSNNNPDRVNMNAIDKYFVGKRKIIEAYNNKLSESNEGYVVFGFDTNHLDDDKNPDLKDPDYIMRLTEQMQDQLLLFRDKYEEYKNAHDSVKSIVRKTIIDNIRREADIQCELGLNGLLDKLIGPED